MDKTKHLSIFREEIKRLELFFGKQDAEYVKELWTSLQAMRLDAFQWTIQRIMDTRPKRFGFPVSGDFKEVVRNWQPAPDVLMLPAGEPKKSDLDKVAKFMRLMKLRFKKKGGLTQEEFARRVKEVMG